MSTSVNQGSNPGFNYTETMSSLKLSPEFANLRHTRATKIIATLGPATSSEEAICDLIKAGTNIFRLNFSHANYNWALATLQIIRKVSDKLDCPVAVLQDLQGPKIRISEIPTGEMVLNIGEKVHFSYGKSSTNKDEYKTLHTQAFDPKEVLTQGARVYLADAKVELIVDKVTEKGVITTVTRGGTLKSKAGIALPNSQFILPATSEKDLQDLEWGLENGVDYIALSFVSSAQDIISLRQEMEKRGKVVPIIAKIERKEALAHLEEIIQAADAVMIARGDLGVDIPYELVPAVQRRIIALAHKYGKPVIVATQMLPSMVEADIPSRAETSDVFLAAELGADAVMLSEETSVGKNPSACVIAMAKIVDIGEGFFNFEAHHPELSNSLPLEGTEAELVALCACAASRSSKIDAIIVCSETGNTARLVAKYRPQVPIYGMSTSRDTLSRMALYWGVNPIAVQLSNSGDEERAFNVVTEQFFIKHPEAKEFGAVVVTGAQPGKPHSVSGFEVRRVGRYGGI